MRHTSAFLVTLLALFIAPLSLFAQDGAPPEGAIIVEGHSTGQNFPSYVEGGGPWQDFPATSAAPGLTARTLRILKATNGVFQGTAKFHPNLAKAGTYDVQVAWPGNANVRSVRFSVEGATAGAPLRSADFAPRSMPDSKADTWVSLGIVQLPAGAEAAIAADPTGAEGPVDASMPYEFAISGIRFVPSDTSAERVASLMPANPFEASAPPAKPDPSPVATPIAVIAAAVQTANPEDPFSAPAPAVTPAPPGSRPTHTTAMPVDPFAVEQPAATPAPAGSTQPFVPAPGATDPFAQPAPAQAPTPTPRPAPTPASTPRPRVIKDTEDPTPATSLPADVKPTNPFEGPQAVAPTPGALTAVNPFENPSMAPAFESTPSPTVGAPGGERPHRVESFSPTPEDTQRSVPSAPPDFDANPAMGVPSALQSLEGLKPSIDRAETSLEAGLKRGAAEKKPVAVVFYSETVAFRTFDSAVLQNDEVRALLGRCVPVILELRNNKLVADRYSVRRSPYTIILDSNGSARGHVGEPKSASRYAAELRRAMQ